MRRGVTFEVASVERSTTAMEPLDAQARIGALVGRRVEALGFESGGRPLVACADVNPLVQAACDAFYGHCPLTLSPDAVWFTLAQGFANHVRLNAEALRGRFVRHQGKAKLIVERQDFILGQPNPWPEAFAAFSEQIAGHVGKLRDVVVGDFSTTGPTERAAMEVLLMDTFAPYFEYEMMCGCGIPAVTLLGEPEDWRSIRRRAAVFAEYGLEGWVAILDPLLGQLVEAAEGRADVDLWRSFFRYRGGSGPAEMTGWINVLFPYLYKDIQAKVLAPNPFMEDWSGHLSRPDTRQSFIDFAMAPRGPGLDQMPTGIASAPVKVKMMGGAAPVDVAMRFAGGLFGVVQDPVSLALEPAFGWAILYDEA